MNQEANEYQLLVFGIDIDLLKETFYILTIENDIFHISN